MISCQPLNRSRCSFPSDEDGVVRVLVMCKMLHFFVLRDTISPPKLSLFRLANSLIH